VKLTNANISNKIIIEKICNNKKLSISGSFFVFKIIFLEFFDFLNIFVAL